MSLGEYSGMERRKYVRVPAEIPLKINFRGQSLVFPAAFSRDISTGGLGVELDAEYADVSGELLAYRGELEVEVQLPEEGERLDLMAEVCWVAKSEENEGAVLMGLRFKGLADADRDRLGELVKDLVDAEYRERILSKYEKPPGKR